MNGAKFFDVDECQLFYEKGLAIPSRTIYMGSEWSDREDKSEMGVDFRLADHVIKGLHILNSMDNVNDISLILNNVGGDEYHGLAIYDAIKVCLAPVNITVFGQVMSMGSVILQAGNKRLLSPHATMMIHMGSLSLDIDQRDINAYKKEWDRMNGIVDDIYLTKLRTKNPRYSVNQLHDLLSTDRFMGPQEVIELGLADEVLT